MLVLNKPFCKFGSGWEEAGRGGYWTLKRGVYIGKIGLTDLPKSLLQLVEPGCLEDSSEEKSKMLQAALRNTISVPKL